MRSGTGSSFSKVPVLADNGIITKTYLHDLEAAVRQRTPVAGANIDIKVTDGSFVISATAGVNIAVAGGGGTGGFGVPEGFTAVTLTVCSNGTPAQLIVFGRVD
jgi:hypothetical protein